MEKLLSAQQVGELFGVKRSQLANLAQNGRIPGAYRKDGYHFAYPDSADLREAAKLRKTGPQKRRPKPNRRVRDTETYITCITDFEAWYRKAAAQVPNWNSRDIALALEHFRPVLEFLDWLKSQQTEVKPRRWNTR